MSDCKKKPFLWNSKLENGVKFLALFCLRAAITVTHYFKISQYSPAYITYLSVNRSKLVGSIVICLSVMGSCIAAAVLTYTQSLAYTYNPLAEFN